MIKKKSPKKESSSAKTDIEKFLDYLKKNLEKKIQQLEELSATSDVKAAIAAIQDEMSRTIDLIAECSENCQITVRNAKNKIVAYTLISSWFLISRSPVRLRDGSPAKSNTNR